MRKLIWGLWHKRLSRVFRGASGGGRRPRSVSPYRPRLEALEDRVVPTIALTGPSAIIPGAEATFTINYSPTQFASGDHNVTLQATLPTELDVLSVTAIPNFPGQSPPNPDGFIYPSQSALQGSKTSDITFTAANVKALNADTFQIVALAPSNLQTLSAPVTVTETSANDSNPIPPQTSSPTVTPVAGLAVSQTGPSSVVANRDAFYTVTVSNDGPSDSQQVTLSDVMTNLNGGAAPSLDIANTKQLSGPDSFTFDPKTASFTAASVGAGDTDVFLVAVAIPKSVQGVEVGTEINSATVTSNTPNPNAADNTAQTSTTVFEGNIALSPSNVSGTEFNASNGVTAASFTHAKGLEPASAFTATITWGDGATSLGIVSQPGGTGTPYIVQGSHTYLGDGNYTVTVNITDGNASVSANGTANIGDAGLPAGTYSWPMASPVQETLEDLFPVSAAGLPAGTYPWPTASPVLETLEDLFHAPLSAFQLNDLDITLLSTELAIATQLMNSGMDTTMAYFLAPIIGQDLFYLYAGIVSADGMPLNAAVTEMATGLANIGQGQGA